MTARLILLPPTDAARDRLNDLRDGQRKIAAAERKGDESKLFFLREWYAEQAVALVDELLRGAVYSDDTPDPRVAALEAQIEELEARCQRWKRAANTAYDEWAHDEWGYEQNREHESAWADLVKHGDAPAEEPSE